MRDALTAPDDLHTADGAHACARVSVVSDHMARQGRRYDTYAMAAGVLQGLQALSPRQWPPLGAFIKLPALRVVHDFDCRAGDGTVPASRFFRRGFPDLFETVLAQINDLPRPRKRPQAIALSA